MTIYSTAALPKELAELELTDDTLTVAAYRALAQKQGALGHVSFETALRLVVYLHNKNNSRAFDLEYELAVVDVVLRALQWYDFDVKRTFTALVTDWLLRYEHYDDARRRFIPCDALRRALTTAYTT